MCAIRFLAEMVGLYHRIQHDGYSFFVFFVGTWQLPCSMVFFFLFPAFV